MLLSIAGQIFEIQRFFYKQKELDINYIAIEPSPEEFKCLKSLKNNLVLRDSKAYNFAFFDKNDSLKFFISSNYGDSSIFEPVTYTHEKKFLQEDLIIFMRNQI